MRAAIFRIKAKVPLLLTIIKELMENPIMKYFESKHLPPKLAEVSFKIGYIAEQLNTDLPNCAEKSAGLRKLLEAKDCFVRAALEKE